MSYQKGIGQSSFSLESESGLSSDPYWNVASRRDEAASSASAAMSTPTKRRKQNLSSYGRPKSQMHGIFDADPFESEFGDSLEGTPSEWTGLPLAADRSHLSPVKVSSGPPKEIRHVDITSEDPFGSPDKSEEKTRKSKKISGKMKSTFDDIPLDELRRYRRLSGNTLWGLVQKRKMGLGPSTAADDASGLAGGNAGGTFGSAVAQAGGTSGAGAAGPGPAGGVGGGAGASGGASTGNDKALNKRLQQLWGCLPEKERRVWKGKAKRIMKQLQGIQRKEASQAAAGKQVSPEVVRQKERQRIANRMAAIKMTSFNTGDLAAYIKLVGDGLYTIGRNLVSQNAPVAVHGTESVLLDSLACSLPPLIALCNQVPGLEDTVDHDDMCDTLDSIAYLMPGLY